MTVFVLGAYEVADPNDRVELRDGAERNDEPPDLEPEGNASAGATFIIESPAITLSTSLAEKALGKFSGARDILVCNLLKSFRGETLCLTLGVRKNP